MARFTGKGLSDARLDVKQLMRSGVFRTRTDMVYYLLLRCIRDAGGEAVGSWTLKAHLAASGLECGTATVGRHLKDMDSRELTVRRSNQGRVLTPFGESHLERCEENLTRANFSDAVSDALRVNRFEELIDLFRTRQTLETEIARQAAERGSDEDFVFLREALAAHRLCIDEHRDPTETSLGFHLAVARVGGNKFMFAILDMLIYEEKRIELLFSNLVTRERGTVYIRDHEKITDAIIGRNPPLASSLMHGHIETMCRDIQRQAEEKRGRM